jgi:hypothetical protein
MDTTANELHELLALAREGQQLLCVLCDVSAAQSPQ